MLAALREADAAVPSPARVAAVTLAPTPARPAPSEDPFGGVDFDSDDLFCDEMAGDDVDDFDWQGLLSGGGGGAAATPAAAPPPLPPAAAPAPLARPRLVQRAPASHIIGRGGPLSSGRGGRGVSAVAASKAAAAAARAARGAALRRGGRLA